MGIKSVVASQYREIVNQAAKNVKNIPFPPEGWLRTTRNALGMSATQLARRLGKTRGLVSYAEKAELEGSVTLKTMRAMAEMMDCHFVYAIVPEHSAEKILVNRAKDKAEKLVAESSKHMALEQQALSKQQIAFEIKRLQQQMLESMPTDFWNDD